MEAILAAVALLLAPAAAGAGGLAPVAKELSRGARQAGVVRVAVLPFRPVGGPEEGQGRLIAEELSGRLANRSSVRLVERASLDEVMGELALGQTGALDRAGRPEPGRLAAAEAVVTGVYASLGGKAEVHARLVRVEDGIVLASARAVVIVPPFPAAGVIPAPAAFSAEDSAAEALAFQGRAREALLMRRAAARRASAPETRPASNGDDLLRDAPADECAGWQARSDALQEKVLSLKARYWAAQAGKKGYRPPSEAPGSSFFDPSLKRRFLELMEDAVLAEAPMTLVETKEFLEADRDAWTLRARCGGRRP